MSLLDLALLQSIHVDVDAIYSCHCQFSPREGRRPELKQLVPSFKTPVVVNSIFLEVRICVSKGRAERRQKWRVAVVMERRWSGCDVKS